MTESIEGGTLFTNLKTICISFMLLFLFSSCTATTATTGTKVLVDQSRLNKLQRLGVTVTKGEDFSVRIAREKMTSVGVAFLGLLGAGIEAAARSSTDAEYTEPFKPVLIAYDPSVLLTEGIIRNLQSEQAFPTVVRVPAEEKNTVQDKGIDGILQIAFKEWGLRLCPSPNTDERVQVGLQIEGRIVTVAKDEILWERNELYLDGECHPIAELRSQKGLLVEILSRAIDHLSGKIVNEIRFP